MRPEEHLAAALKALGLDTDPELADTPRQFAELLAEYTPAPLPPVQPLQTESSDIIVLRDLPFHSLCAHHLVPFFGTATIAYRPNGRIAGLGWFPRTLRALARRPQLQERLADQLAERVVEALGAQAVAVRLTARQLCMEMRGAESQGTIEVLAVRGDDSLVRALLEA